MNDWVERVDLLLYRLIYSAAIYIITYEYDIMT
jgi:hypothetical protein